MIENIWAALPNPPLDTQLSDVRGLSESERDALIISATHVDDKWVIISRYGDDIWHLDGFASNVPSRRRQLDFSAIAPKFRAVMKAILYRYLRESPNKPSVMRESPQHLIRAAHEPDELFRL